MVGCLVWFCECQFELMDLSISDLLQSILFVMLVSTFGHLWAVGVYSGWVLSLLHTLQKSWLFFFLMSFFACFGFFVFGVTGCFQFILYSICSALESSISPSSPVFFQCEMVFKDYNLDVRGDIALAYCFLAFFHQTKLEYIFKVNKYVYMGVSNPNQIQDTSFLLHLILLTSVSLFSHHLFSLSHV